MCWTAVAGEVLAIFVGCGCVNYLRARFGTDPSGTSLPVDIGAHEAGTSGLCVVELQCFESTSGPD